MATVQCFVFGDALLCPHDSEGSTLSICGAQVGRLHYQCDWPPAHDPQDSNDQWPPTPSRVWNLICLLLLNFFFSLFRVFWEYYRGLAIVCSALLLHYYFPIYTVCPTTVVLLTNLWLFSHVCVIHIVYLTHPIPNHKSANINHNGITNILNLPMKLLSYLCSYL